MEHHIVLTNGRSGSNYLVNLINQHPHLTNYGEVLGEWTLAFKVSHLLQIAQWDSERYLNNIYSSRLFFYTAQAYSAFARVKQKKNINFKRIKNIKSIGIKDFSINFIRKNAKNYLAKNQDIKIINLYRENHLNRYISYLSLQQSGIVKIDQNNHKKSQNKQAKVRVPASRLIQEIAVIEKETHDQLRLVRQLDNNRVYHLKYEDFFTSSERQKKLQSDIFNFLGVQPINVQGSNKKILPNDLSQVIENYDECVTALRGTRFEKYLFS